MLTSNRRASDYVAIDISKYRFEITRECVECLESYRQFEDRELCGIVIGSTIDDKYYRISYISEPCNRNSSTNMSCERDAKKANTIITEEYMSSNRTRVYLGEWHTHPENSPKPSRIDVISISEIYKTADLAIDGVIFCIVGLSDIYWGFYHAGKIFNIVPVVIT